VGRLRIVAVEFTANAFGRGHEPRAFPEGEALIFLRRDEEEGWTVGQVQRQLSTAVRGSLATALGSQQEIGPDVGHYRR
jgi:hypothetical protein